MPKVIKSFIARRNPLVIGTKSTLILRDIELIKELNNIAEVSVIISVSTLDEDKRKLIEPNTAPTIERLKMLKQFEEIGCKTSVLFMPIIPFISDDQENLDGIFRITKEYSLELQNRVMKLRKKYQIFSSYKPTKASDNKEIQMSLFD